MVRVIILHRIWLLGLALGSIASAAPGNRRSAAGDPQPDRSEIYRKVGAVQLEMHLFVPKGHHEKDRRAAIVFFFGGGWKSGTARQFYPQCRMLAERGLVAMSADYRVYDRHQAMVVDCVADAQAAVRWVRANSRRLGIDADRIAAGGGSAGGHLAAATALLDDLTGEADSTVSFRPNALLLFNPALDLTLEPGGPKRRLRIEERLGAPAEKLSPADHVRSELPPTLIFHGKDDELIPYSTIEAFTRSMRDAGNRCEVVGFDGQGHGFFNQANQSGRYFNETMRDSVRFLESIHFLERGTTASKSSEHK